MSRIVLNPTVIDKIKQDTDLKKLVAKELGVAVRSLDRLLYGNDSCLTQAGVLRLLRLQLNFAQDTDLLCEMQINSIDG